MSVLAYPAATGVVLGDQNGAIPPLENGDHLTRAEFLRRYDGMPDVKKAELIEGVVCSRGRTIRTAVACR